MEHGLHEFHNWFDTHAWFPFGRVAGFTIYPALMWTAAAAHWVLNTLSITIEARNVCVMLAPVMAANTTLVTYLLGKEIKDSNTGLLAAALIAIVPGYISRSVAGSFDNEGVAIFALITTFYLFVKAVNTGSLLLAGSSAIAYYYMSAAWGGYIFIINLLPLYVVIMLFAGRYSHRLYVAYCTLYILGTLLSMQVRFVGFQAVQSSEHLAAAGTFVLIQIHAMLSFLKHQLKPEMFSFLFKMFASIFVTFTVSIFVLLWVSGYITPWTGRFYSLLDPTYAKEHIPIIASVAEHQPTTWASFFFDLHILTMLFPAGIYYCFKALKEGDKKGDAKVFVIVYGISSVYFAGVMVRLMLVLAPVACILGAIALTCVLSTYMPYIRQSSQATQAKRSTEKTKSAQDGKELPIQRELAVVMVLAITFLLFFFVHHSIWVTSEVPTATQSLLRCHTLSSTATHTPRLPYTLPSTATLTLASPTQSA